MSSYMVSDPERRPARKKPVNKIDRYLISSAVIMLIYTVIVLFCAWHEKIIPPELTVALFAAFGGEIWACAWIKRLKIKEGEKDGNSI